MHSFEISRPSPLPIRLFLIAATVAALLLPASAGAAGKRVAKEGTVASLGKTVLANNAGRTLYSLSVEKNGNFICTGACLSVWHPLVVAAGTKPTGPAKLGTVKRPDGRTQVTYKGRPLYSFNGDTKAGEANGEGIKDVGTWHAATLSSAPPMSEAPSQSPAPYSPPSGY